MKRHIKALVSGMLNAKFLACSTPNIKNHIYKMCQMSNLQ